MGIFMTWKQFKTIYARFNLYASVWIMIVYRLEDT